MAVPKMSESKDYDYASVDESDDEALLDGNRYGNSRRQSRLMTSRMMSWILYAIVVVSFLGIGVAIGYSIKGTAAKGLVFADTSHLRRCMKIFPSSFLHINLTFLR